MREIQEIQGAKDDVKAAVFLEVADNGDACAMST
jgi:hypothetical protein